MIGKRNGMILITSLHGKGAKGQTKWNYICDCGNIGVITTGEFNRNRAPIKSCGCNKPSANLEGKRFGKLEVVKVHHKKGYKYQWLCKCDCGNLTIVEQSSLTRGSTKSCGGGCFYYTPDRFEKKRKLLISRIIVDNNNCWIWQGPKKTSGYGCFNCGLIDQTVHRAAYKLFVGEIPNNLCVLHKCDIKSCCNPEHLYLGDIKQNVKDAIERGQFPRGPNPKKGHIGVKNCKAKLTEDQVLEIRKLYKPSIFGTYKISKLFVVSNQTIKQIIKRKLWNHI